MKIVVEAFDSSTAPQVARGAQITPEAKAEIAKAFGLLIPPTAEFLFYEHEAWLDQSFQIKLRMSQIEAESLLHHFPTKNAFWPSTNMMEDDARFPEWTPSKARRFRALSIDNYSQGYLRVLVDYSDVNTALVYVQWYTT